MKNINMKRILLFLGLSLAALVSYSQIYGRLRVYSGTLDNFFVNTTPVDSFKLGWTSASFRFNYNGNKRFMAFNKADSTVEVFNKLTILSPNDTALSVRGRSYFGGVLDFPYNLRFRSTNTSLFIGHNVVDAPVAGATYNVGLGYSALAAIASGGTYNIGIGYNAGTAISTGDHNIAIGRSALSTNQTTGDNIAIGYEALTQTNSGGANVAIGTWALRVGSYGGVAIGHRCLQAGGGGGNVGMGYTTMLNLGSTSIDNTAIGHVAMQIGTAGNYNTGIGAWSLYYTGQSGAAANNNSAIGWKAGYNNRSGSDNTFLGFNAGFSVQSGSGNIFIGSNAGYSETGSNKLYIDNSSTATPLIYGDFDNNKVRINGTDTALTLIGDMNLIDNSIYFNNNSYINRSTIYIQNSANYLSIDNSGADTYLELYNDSYEATSILNSNKLGINDLNNDPFFIYSLRNNERFMSFIYDDSTTTIYNKLILESPNDTMLSVKGNTHSVGNIYSNEYRFNNSSSSYIKGDDLYIENPDDGSNYINLYTDIQHAECAIGGDTAFITVDATNPTTGHAYVQINGLFIYGKSLNVLDDGTIVPPTGIFGKGTVQAFNAGTEDEYAEFRFNSDGSVTLTESTANVTTTGGTDNSLNIYDGGAGIIIENKLGGTRTLKVILNY